MGEKDLKANLNFVTKNKKDLLKKHENKFILVFEQKVTGSYDTYEKAAEKGVSLYGLDASFLVHHMVKEELLNIIKKATI